MEKRKFLIMLLIFSAFSFQAFSQEKAKWKQMDDFHAVMSPTFHPAEEDNLAPVKEKAGDLLSAAKTWQSSVVPVGFKTDLTKPILKRLVKECGNLKKAVDKGKTDAELKTMITNAHEIFHEIMEKCRD